MHGPGPVKQRKLQKTAPMLISVISVPCVPGLISAEVLKSFPGLGLSLRGLDLGTLPLTMVADRG